MGSDSDTQKRAASALAKLEQALADLADDDRIPLHEKEELIGRDYLFVQGVMGLPGGYRLESNGLKEKDDA